MSAGTPVDAPAPAPYPPKPPPPMFPIIYCIIMGFMPIPPNPPIPANGLAYSAAPVDAVASAPVIDVLELEDVEPGI